MSITRNQIISAIGVILLLTLAWFLRGVIVYFLVATVLSFLGAPLVDFFEKKIKYRGKNLPRGLFAAIVLLIFCGIIALFGWLVIPSLITQGQKLSEITHSQFDSSFKKPIADVKLLIKKAGGDPVNFSTNNLKNVVMNYVKSANAGVFLSSIIGGLSRTLGWISIVLFITFFFLKEKLLVIKILHFLTPDKYEEKMRKSLREINKLLTAYFRSLLLQVVVFGIYIFSGLKIVGEEYALTVAIFSGIINLVSYIGPLLGLGFALLFSVCGHIGADFYGVMVPELLQVIMVYVIAIALDNFVSYPLIFSNTLKVHPLELFFIILAGGQLAGIMGMLLAAPTYTIFRVIAKEFLQRYEIIRDITKSI